MIAFMPTYKFDENNEYIWSKNPSFTDRIFYSTSWNLNEMNTIRVIEYDSFTIPSCASDHKGV